MSKFGSLAADVSAPFKVEIIDPVTEEVIRDNSQSEVDPKDPEGKRKLGRAMFISVWSADSDRARTFDKQKRKELQIKIRQSRTGKVEQDDALEQNMAKCAALTDSWYLVDRVTGEQIDVPCTPENAAELYSTPGMGWLFIQPWVGANDPANFLQRPSKSSSDTAKPSGDQIES